MKASVIIAIEGAIIGVLTVILFSEHLSRRAETSYGRPDETTERKILKMGGAKSNQQGDQNGYEIPKFKDNAFTSGDQLDLKRPVTGRARSKMHRKYDKLLIDKLHRSTADCDRFVDLMIERDAVYSDIRNSVAENDLNGSNVQVQALMGTLLGPIQKDLDNMLGPDGEKALVVYDSQQYYQTAYINQMEPRFDISGSPLSEAQTEQLSAVLASNDHPQPPVNTNISPESSINWSQVSEEASNFLSPSQMSALKDYIAAKGISLAPK